eukprot:CAMPEP_0206185708 /NCGR_PEP_ID=MMETSP0166-20121206/1966_1 /ASSEMBLY_ACC=CAM_ASM_000260 /TAXON_ID=95228 /ORGANISM="Vannella robusta, Strain DIVA3 518/3/11/1/6" /LENGTH=219 /DNA_ID=CAMNT_0053600949 /DNA_START=38 /DNA_END=697 /DNA_ORIENTATION=-
MVQKLVFLFVLAVLSVSSANHCSARAPCHQERIYNGCHCFVEWNDANSVGNWTVKENWLQLAEPAWPSFVSISGDNTITVDEERRINELYVGPNRWDTTRLVIDEDLTIVYDDVPVISRVQGFRLATGEVRLVIQGKGFGFVSEDVSVVATEFYENDDDANIEDHELFEYQCEHVTLTYRDAKIECNIPAANLMPYTLQVQVSANGFTTDFVQLSEHIK